MTGAAVMVGATVVAAGGAIEGGVQQRKAARQAGRAEEQDALAQAVTIRKSAKQVRSAARAAYSASGVAVDEGSAALVDADIVHGSEEDALNTILTGNRRKSTLYQSGRNAALAGGINAAGTVLSYGGRQGNWLNAKSGAGSGPGGRLGGVGTEMLT